MGALTAGWRCAAVGQAQAAGVEFIRGRHRAPYRALRLRTLQTGHAEAGQEVREGRLEGTGRAADKFRLEGQHSGPRSRETSLTQHLVLLRRA